MPLSFKKIMPINSINLKFRQNALKILKIFRFLFLISIDNSEKRFDLYELREKIIFLIKVFKFNKILERILFLSLNGYFNFFQKMFFPITHQEEKNLNNLIIGEIKLEPYLTISLNKKKKIMFRSDEIKANLSEIFLKNYILVTRTKILREFMFKIYYVPSELSQKFSVNFLTMTLDIRKKLKFFGFSKKLLKKLFFILNSNFNTSFKKKNLLSRNGRLKFFYFEELMGFFKTNLSKKYVCEISKIFSFEKFFYLGKIKDYREIFESKKFLKKLFKLKKIKKLRFQQGFSFKPQTRKKDLLNFFNLQKNKYLFSPKFKGQKLFLEISQKNLNLYWEFEKLKIKLLCFFYLKIYLKNNRFSINVYIHHLFLFKILNLLNIFKSKTLNLSLMLEKNFYGFYTKTKSSYRHIRKFFPQSTKLCIFNNSSYFEDENIYLINSKLTQLINTLVDRIKVSTNPRKNKAKQSLPKILIKSKKKKNQFLKEIGNWDSIFYNRFIFFLLFFSDSSIFNLNVRIFQFNSFDFRRIGF